jgi:Phosphotransferase enzyme family
VPCHRDYTPRNWLARDGVQYVIDFEHARLDVWLADLAWLHLGIWPDRPDLKDAFLAGYSRQLSDTDHAILQDLAALTATWLVVKAREIRQPALEDAFRTALQRLLPAGAQARPAASASQRSPSKRINLGRRSSPIRSTGPSRTALSVTPDACRPSAHRRRSACWLWAICCAASGADQAFLPARFPAGGYGSAAAAVSAMAVVCAAVHCTWASGQVSARPAWTRLAIICRPRPYR